MLPTHNDRYHARAALVFAIDRLEREEKAMGYTGPSGTLSAWQELLAKWPFEEWVNPYVQERA